MSLLTLNRSTIGTLLTLAIAFSGGWLGHWLAADAGWLLGSLLATLLATFKGLPLRYSPLLQSTVVVLVGVSIGSALSSDMVGHLGHWIPSLAGLCLSVVLTLAVVAYYLKRHGQCDHNTSVLSAYPGHLIVILQLASQHPCDVQKVVTIQSLRMLFLVLILPTMAYIWMPEQSLSESTTNYAALCWLFLAGGAGAMIAWLLNVSAALLIGAIAGSGFVALNGVTVGTLPDVLKVTIFTLTGAMIGTRFINTQWSTIAKTLPVALSAMSITMLVSATIALPIALMTDISVIQLLLAYAPGGAEVMSLIALATGHDPAFVGLHHIARLLAMAAFFPLLVKLAIR